MSWQVESHVPLCGGSHVSGATTQLSPQLLGLHTWLVHTPPLVTLVAHAPHDARTVPATHFCPPLLPGPDTVWHTCGAALHGSKPGQAFGASALFEQLKVQSGSHPEP
jgi:hypothetical protein